MVSDQVQERFALHRTLITTHNLQLDALPVQFNCANLEVNTDSGDK